MKKFILIFLISLFSFSAFSLSEYHVENPELLKTSQLKIESNWDFYWARFVRPSDTSEPDFVVTVPSSWNKYDLPDDIKEITKTGKGSGTFRLKLTGLLPEHEYAVPVF
jgi:hypothetical protein